MVIVFLVALGVFVMLTGLKPVTGWDAPLKAIPYRSLVKSAADSWGIPPALLAAVALVESGFNAGAVNMTAGDGARGGSYGLCQLSLLTARGLRAGVTPLDLLDPATNLYLAAQYIAQLARSGLSMPDCIGAYNVGPDMKPADLAEIYRKKVFSALSKVAG